MDPRHLATRYDKIAQWWHTEHHTSNYGMQQLERAIGYTRQHRQALDVGCGTGGRMIYKLQQDGFVVSGVDVSAQMIHQARVNHPEVTFYVEDICKWSTSTEYDLIVAWDSLFHLPLDQHVPVINKLCNMLEKDGIILYTFGDDYGEHESIWHNDNFYYSTIGIQGNLEALAANHFKILHLELDQYPERHVCIIAQRMM